MSNNENDDNKPSDTKLPYDQMQFPTRQDMRLEIERLRGALKNLITPKGWLSQPVSEWNKVLLERDHTIANLEVEVERLGRVIEHKNGALRDHVNLGPYHICGPFIAAGEGPNCPGCVAYRKDKAALELS